TLGMSPRMTCTFAAKSARFRTSPTTCNRRSASAGSSSATVRLVVSASAVAAPLRRSAAAVAAALDGNHNVGSEPSDAIESDAPRRIFSGPANPAPPAADVDDHALVNGAALGGAALGNVGTGKSTEN